MEPDGSGGGASGVKALETIDPATGLLNAHGWLAYAKRHLKRAVCSQQRLGLVLLRVYNYQQLKQGRGVAAEVALQQLAEALQLLVRPGDLLGRWREADFILLLPYVEAGAIDHIAQRLLQGIRKRPIFLGAAVFALRLGAGGASVIVTRGELHELDGLIAEGERQLLQSAGA